MTEPKLKTGVPVPQGLPSIRYADSCLLMGSCFAENMGKKLRALRFNSRVNPLGIIYHPVALAQSLSRIINRKEFQHSELVEREGLYAHWELHSQFSSTNPDRLIHEANKALRNGQVFLSKSRVLVITFGTAWAYLVNERNQVVANCHRFPQEFFEKTLWSAEDIVSTWNDILRELEAAFPDMQIIFSLSPVRHWKDGAVQNSLSKAILLQSIHELVMNRGNCHYFPAYEIQMDELRDYRYYGEDLLHPNNTAIEIIWNRFQEACMSKETRHLAAEFHKLKLTLAHRPRFPESKESVALAQNLTSKMRALLGEKIRLRHM